MQFKLTNQPLAELQADAVLGYVFEEGSQGAAVKAWGELTDNLAEELLARKEFKGAFQTSVVIHRPSGLKAERLILAGYGTREQGSNPRLRDCTGSTWRSLRSSGIKTLAVSLPDGIPEQEAIQAVLQGLLLSDYDPGVYKTSRKQESSLQTVLIAASNELQVVLDRTVAIVQAQNYARELANEPGNLLPPRVLAARVETMAQDCGLKSEVIWNEQLDELGMGALLGVARGSSEPPVLIIVQYQPENDTSQGKTHLGLVGKAVTFDTGGISLKPSPDMDLMKYDMAGGAATIGAMQAIAKLKPSIPVTAVIPSVENMPDGEAQRPGDVVTTRNGTTVEVLNTDAEGRLILADAMTYARELGCTQLVDAATLTGAIVVALGFEYSGLFSNNSQWQQQVMQASCLAGEKYWPMPIGEEYTKQLESPIADLANIGPRWGGAVTAAAFLEHFAEKTPWVHLDIAGTAWYEKTLPHAPKGPSGVGVRTMVELAMSLG